MGLPFHTKVLYFEMGVPRSVFQCGGFAPEPGLDAAYTYMIPTLRDPLCLQQEWQKYSKEVGEHTVLFVDPNHNPPAAQASPFVHNRLMAVYLDGDFSKFVKMGNWNRCDFW